MQYFYLLKVSPQCWFIIRNCSSKVVRNMKCEKSELGTKAKFKK